MAFLVDRATKLLALSFLPPARTNAHEALFSCVLYFDRSVSLSLFQNHTYTALTGALFAAIILFACLHCEEFRSSPGTPLLLAGAAGNLFDRILYGYGVDWFYVGVYTNIADISLALGGFWLLTSLFIRFVSNQAREM